MSAATGSNNTGHGHVYPRPDGVRARCGGPAMCVECSGDYVRQNSREAKHPMTDIDAIRELRTFLCGEGPLDGCWFGERHLLRVGMFWWRKEARERFDALLAAFDAKCEELRGMALLKERMWQSESECVELRHHVARLGAKVSALDASLGTVIAERDAAHREKAAAMGLVEGHALTIAKLEAERDAAVRDAQRYRWLRNRGYIAGINGRPFCVYDGKAYRYGYELDDAIDAQLAALAPPTEQQKVML